MIKENVIEFLKQVPERNPFGEPISVVAAVKFQTVESINEAIAAGITAIGDNHVQEFKDKYDGITGARSRQFIGHLQTNKVKYLIGKCDLYQSVDRLELAEELSKRSQKAGVVSNVLVQINIGNEESKSGFDLAEADEAVATVTALPGLRVQGLMAMLPLTDDQAELTRLATAMRNKYDALKAVYPQFTTLSMGMSGDWPLCVACGANMIRVGTVLFGPRQYH